MLDCMARSPLRFQKMIVLQMCEYVIPTACDLTETISEIFQLASLARGQSVLTGADAAVKYCRCTDGAGPSFVPLSQLATIDVTRSPNELWRENQQPVITVTAEVGDRDLGSISREIQSKMARCNPARRLSLGIGGQLSKPARVVFQLDKGFDCFCVTRFLNAQHPVQEPHSAGADFPFATIIAFLRTIRTVDHGNAAKRVVVHGGNTADRT